MKCPVCKTKRLTVVELDESLKADTCEECQGNWLSEKHYASWLQKHGDILPEKCATDTTIEINDVQTAKICPDCGHILLRYRVGHGTDFYIDRCSACGGIWLDKNEWDALKDRNLHDEINGVFSSDWQQNVRREETQQALELLYEKRLGAPDHQKATDIKEWIDGHSEKSMILAFLQG